MGKGNCMMGQKLISILAVILLFQGTLYSQNLDIDILRDINLNRDRYLDNTFRGITNSADYVSFGVPVILLGTGLLIKNSITTQNALFIGASVLTAAAFSTAIKYSVNRPRPFETYPDIQKCADGGSPSFPSGHTSDAFALATAASLAYPKWYLIAPAYIWAGAVGYSRMDLGVHYPSDVIFGAIVGAGSAYVCYVINQKLHRKLIKDK